MIGPAFQLIVGVGAVLVLASLVGAGLKMRFAAGRPHETLDNLNARIRAWWTIAALFGLAAATGAVGVSLLFALASLLALREFATAGSARTAQRPCVAATFVALPLQYLLAVFGPQTAFALALPLAALMALLLGAWRPESQAPRCAAGLLLCVYSISHVPALLALDVQPDPTTRIYLVVFLVLVVQASDVLQYLWGKLAGGPKIAPRISPSKTVAGTLGGIASASVLGACLASITPFSAGEAAAVALLLATLGFAGGLALSALKRRRGIKDWGESIAGHGGVLDRIDSLCLSAPAFYYVVGLGWIG